MNKKGGFIRLIVLLIIVILVLGYFNIDLKSLAEKPATKNNIGYVVSVGGQVWKEYLSKPAEYFWNNIFLDLIWKAFRSNFDLLKQGQAPLDFGQPGPPTP